MDERSKELGRLYKTTWQQVKEAVNATDPEGLLAMGAPDSEYEDAVFDLTRRLLKGSRTDEVSLASWFESWLEPRYGTLPSTRALATHALAERLTAIADDLKRQGDR